ncbi:MAG: ATP-binding protein [Anaerolineaceae bacterium]
MVPASLDQHSTKSPGDSHQDFTLLDRSLILELIPAAALVYRRTDDKILSANRKFYDLTAFTPDTLKEISLYTLIPGDPDTNPTGDQSRPVRLQIASGDLILATMRILPISLTNQVVVLTFSPPDSEFEIRRDLLEQEYRFDNFSLLTTLGSQNSSQAVFQTANQILQRMLNPKLIISYRINPRDEKQLQRNSSSSQADAFPDKLNIDLLENMSTLQLWKLTREPQNVLQESALMEGYHYLLTLPLLHNNSPQGLMIAAGEAPYPDDDTLRYLALMSAHAASAIQGLNSLERAQRTLNNIRHVVQIQHAITDNLEEGVIILTPDLRIAEMNPAAEFLLGYASKEVFRQKADMVLIGNETLSALYKSAQQGISTLVGNNFSLNNRSGGSFMAQVLCIPVVEKEKVRSIVLILRDISQTEQIRAHSQQLEQRAFLGEVSAIFAHEVKNPINSISTGLQLMGLTMKPDDPHADLVSRLQNDCLRLTHLMDSTLTFSKPVEYNFAPVDLASLINSILERWAPRMYRLNISYNLEQHPANPLVLADARAIEQVFVNLISNAIQAMENEGGSLNVKIHPVLPETNPPQYEIIVADSGPGIPEDLIKHVFEPFLTTKANGTGLGLAISRRIVMAHKGNIFVESFPGGTMFHVLLLKAT